MTDSRLVVVVGETASGKSALAHELAIELGGEIICADSRTVYSGMDVGTAKPTKSERVEVQYHLLDVAEPDEGYNAARFKKDANIAIAEIAAKERLPIMVGGTGLFVDSVLFDFEFGQAFDSEKRQQLAGLSLADLQQQALKIDKNLDKSLLSNKRHLVRLIEVGGQKKQPQILRENTLVIGLQIPRNELRKRIEQRTEQMFRRGLRKEVDELVERYGWDCEAMTGIGYREFKDYNEGKISMGEVKNNIVKNTLKYAKRQRTWFKRNPHIQWYDDSELAFHELKKHIEQM
jgi:tRNA dimethylallyltransferase